MIRQAITIITIIAILAFLVGVALTVRTILQNRSLQMAYAELAIEKATLQADNEALALSAKLSREVADVARKERARMAINAARFTKLRDAMMKGNFHEELPDAFARLVACSLWGSPTAEGDHEDDDHCN